MAWIRCEHTFRNGLQRFTDRRYRIVLISDVLMDRLLHDVVGVSEAIMAGMQEGFTLFQAIMDTSREGLELKNAEIWGFGFLVDQGCWCSIARHESFAPVMEGQRCPEQALTFEDGDIQRIKLRYWELLNATQEAP